MRRLLESWKRNLAVLWIAELLAIAGFSFIIPFLPYFVQELGVTELHEVELWSGAMFAAHAIPMAISAPIWGMLADRYGRKLMVVRSMIGGAIILGLMGYVQNVQQLVILRAIQGALTGTVAAATTLVASTTPKERSGYALGILQMAVFTGASVGPLIGGVIADTWGHRMAFTVTGILLFCAGIIVWLFVDERFSPPEHDEKQRGSGFWQEIGLVFRSVDLVSMFSVRTLVRLGVRLISPVLPLFVQSLAPASTRIASLTGLITGSQAASSAIGSVTLGRASDRLGYRRVLLICLAIVTMLYVPQAFVTSPWQLLVLQAAMGFVMSGVLASISAMLSNLSPEGHEGAVYGVDASVVSVANAVGPMLGASLAAALGLHAPFLLAAGTFGLASILAWFRVPKNVQKTKSVA